MESQIFACGDGFAFHFREIFSGTLKQSAIFQTREECEAEEVKFKGWDVMAMSKEELILRIKMLLYRLEKAEQDLAQYKLDQGIRDAAESEIQHRLDALTDFMAHPHIGKFRIALPLPRKFQWQLPEESLQQI